MSTPPLRRALVCHGGWPGHQPERTSRVAIDALTDAGFEVLVRTDLDAYADRELMEGLDLVVSCWTMAELTPAQEQGLLAAVRAGTGLAGWHGGLTDSFRGSVDYQFMVGGQWVAHPGGFIDYRVRVSNPDHEVTRGLPDFDVHSEQYFMHLDPSIEVLATTTFSGEHADWIAGTEMPVVWTKSYGTGRVFCTTLGHGPEELLLPVSHEILARGMRWAARVPAG